MTSSLSQLQVLLKPWHVHQLEDALSVFQTSARKLQQGEACVVWWVGNGFVDGFNMQLFDGATLDGTRTG